eukprot:scaffold124820_cov48-Phaeocystis_antarctica.AAC.2
MTSSTCGCGSRSISACNGGGEHVTVGACNGGSIPCAHTDRAPCAHKASNPRCRQRVEVRRHIGYVAGWAHGVAGWAHGVAGWAHGVAGGVSSRACTRSAIVSKAYSAAMLGVVAPARAQRAPHSCRADQTQPAAGAAAPSTAAGCLG